LNGIQKQFNKGLDVALLSLWLSLGTFFVATKLSAARNWVVFIPEIRELIADYGATISIIFFSCVSGQLASGNHQQTYLMVMVTMRIMILQHSSSVSACD